MGKAELAAFLREKERDYLEQGGAVIRYASPEKPNKIKLGAYRKVPNLKEQAWRQELERIERERMDANC
jgi:hypothetical protein